VRDLIHKGKVDEIKEAMEKGSTVGMQTFDAHLFQLFSDGKITLEEALRNADSANNLRLRIKLADDSGLETTKSPFAAPTSAPATKPAHSGEVDLKLRTE
jgi:twitching motility protein PilU